MKRVIGCAIFLILAGTTFSQKKLYYNNPVLSGFYPDPGICRAGDDYYIVNSSFAYFPGLPIFHSKDLVNWKQIGHAMDRPEQLNLDGAGVSRGLFAPSITYYKGTFYIVCTLIDKGGNFIITAKDPKGPWSNPVWLPQVDGIDPSLFIDDDSHAYIVYNSIPPDNKPMHDGHRTIRLRPLDLAALKVTGEEKIIVNGGTDMAKKPVWIEGPHIFKKNGWYYLICAEGGTGYNHSEVVFRSRSINEPFIPYENNPILTQRHLDKSRKYPVTTTGHADFVETKDGKWYAVFLGCRPYEDDYYNIGRETFMTPVYWENDWPYILKGNEEVSYKYPVPMPGSTKKVSNSFGGNAFYKDDFRSPSLNKRFIFLRTVHESWYTIFPKEEGWLAINLRKETCSQKGNPSFIAFRQQNHSCEAVVSLQFTPGNENEKAGLAIFQSETNYYFLCQSLNKSIPVIQLYQSMKDGSLKLIDIKDLSIPSPKEVQLKIEGTNSGYFFSFSPDKKTWILINKEPLDAHYLSTKIAGGFVGSVFAMYATSSGAESTTKALFNSFEYKGKDDVYK